MPALEKPNLGTLENPFQTLNKKELPTGALTQFWANALGLEVAGALCDPPPGHDQDGVHQQLGAAERQGEGDR